MVWRAAVSSLYTNLLVLLRLEPINQIAVARVELQMRHFAARQPHYATQIKYFYGDD